ncbi:MAG: 6-phosphofructokinase [Syntrophobacteraceae bacterium]|nr:6-phosphofructokinase [Syntrophobacteraceae bacterium]
MIKTLAVMTSGGDSPGMNAAVRAVVRRALSRGLRVYGIYCGYDGLLRGGDLIKALNWQDVGNVLQRGGTFLGTARSEQFRTLDGRRRAVENLLDLGVEALVVIGGDGSLTGALLLSNEWPEHVEKIASVRPDLRPMVEHVPMLQVMGLPGSIDNDLIGTDMAIGVDTALNHIVRAIDDLSSTAASHQRTFVIETMGRNCGYLALAATLATGASWVLIPECSLELHWHQRMVESLDKARKTGRRHQMVVIAEGARHPDGLRMEAGEVRKILAEKLGLEVRLTVLGHVQRGGAPSAFDRILAARLGVAAVDLLVDEPGVVHRHMVGVKKNRVISTPLNEVIEKSREIQHLIDSGDFKKSLELRGGAFRTMLDLVEALTAACPSQESHGQGRVVIMTGGADSPGMNAALSIAARRLLDRGVSVLGSRDEFHGLTHGDFVDLQWNDLAGWMGRPSSDIGTARSSQVREDFGRIAENIAKFNIKGIIAIGGLDTYRHLERFIDMRTDFPELNIPVVLVPASIDNNLPGSDLCVGSDTALNNIVQAVDKIRDTAGATRRAFIVETMGKECGFLAAMSALAAGADKAYLPETGISLAELSRDVSDLKSSFESGNRMVIYMRNEVASGHYTTDFLRRLLEEESKDEFEVRSVVLGHVQRGGAPTAFDRILAGRISAAAAGALLDLMESGANDVLAFGLQEGAVASCPLVDALDQIDDPHGRPKVQWFMDLFPVVQSLSKIRSRSPGEGESIGHEPAVLRPLPAGR